MLGSTANDFTGPITLTAGTLSIASDGNLGDPNNGIVFGGGTLKSTLVGELQLGSTRALSGTGSLDVAPGSTVTVLGNTTLTGLTLLNTGTIKFGDGTATANISGNISATNLSGTTTINGNVNMGNNAARSISAAAGGTLVITGDLSLSSTGSSNNRITIGSPTATGTVDLRGNNLSVAQSFTLGTSGDVGANLIINSGNSLGGNTFRFNSGTLQASTPLTESNGVVSGLNVSVGAEAGNPAVFSGSNMEFNGLLTLFKPASYSGELAIKVNNTTSFFGGWAMNTGSGTPSGVTISGPGTLVVSQTNANDLPITVNAATFTLNAAMPSQTASVRATNGGTLTGNATIGGAVTIDSGSVLSPGSGVGTLSADSVSLHGTLKIDLNDADPNIQDVLNVGNLLSLSVAALNLNVTGTLSQPAYIIAHYGALVGSPFYHGHRSAGWAQHRLQLSEHE